MDKLLYRIMVNLHN